MMAVTARTGSPPGIPPPSRSGEIAARTPLPPTTWATRPPCGSPSCPTPPAHRLPSPAGIRRRQRSPHPGLRRAPAQLTPQSSAQITAAARQGQDSPIQPAAQAAPARLRSTPNTTDEQAVHWMPARTAGPAVRMMLSDRNAGLAPATVMTSRTTGGPQPPLIGEVCCPVTAADAVLRHPGTGRPPGRRGHYVMTRLIGPLGPQPPVAAGARLPVVRCRTAGAPGTRYGLQPDQDQEKPWS